MQTSSPSDVLNCFIPKQDTVVIPPLQDPQLQNVAFSVIEAAKSQLSELKLADLFSATLHGEAKSQFIGEFLFHWAGVDSKPPEQMLNSSKKSIHSLITNYVSSHNIEASQLTELICPLLPYLTNANEVDEFSTYLNSSILPDSEVDENAGMADLATLGTVISEVSAESVNTEDSEAFLTLQQNKFQEIRRAFDLCLGTKSQSNTSDILRFSTNAIFGSETTRESDDGSVAPAVELQINSNVDTPLIMNNENIQKGENENDQESTENNDKKELKETKETKDESNNSQ